MIAKVLEEIPKGINIYLSLILYGEDDWLEVRDMAGACVPLRWRPEERLLL